MLPGMELMGCALEVPANVMHHVVKVESSYNPFAIGVVGGHLARQPRNLPEAIATAEMLENRGFNFSLGLAQVNRHNLKKYGITSYRAAFQQCPNLLAGSQILRECHGRAGGQWDKAFSCYYSGNFTTGFRHGYVQKVRQSMLAQHGPGAPSLAIPVVDTRKPARKDPGAPASRAVAVPNRAMQAGLAGTPGDSLLQRRMQVVVAPTPPVAQAPAPVATAAADVGVQAPPTVAVLTSSAPPQPVPPNPRPSNPDSAFVF